MITNNLPSIHRYFADYSLIVPLNDLKEMIENILNGEIYTLLNKQYEKIDQ